MKNIYEYITRYRISWFSDYIGIPMYDISCLHHREISKIFELLDSKLPCIVYDYGNTQYNSYDRIFYRICYKNAEGRIRYSDGCCNLEDSIKEYRMILENEKNT